MNGIVVSVHKTGAEVLIQDQVRFCLRKTEKLPVVGDKVLLEKREDKYFVIGILPRRNLIARYDFYKEKHQGFAANIDVVFIVTSANREFSLNRIKRFLALCDPKDNNDEELLIEQPSMANAYQDKVSLIEPHHTVRGQEVRRVVIVTKVDLNGEIPQVNIDGVEQININALDPNDIKKIAWNGTALLMGSSGVGKSTILNTLCGLNIKTREVQGERLANKGRHTTSARTMYFLADGRRIIDTPGVRIVGAMGEEAETRRQRKRKS